MLSENDSIKGGVFALGNFDGVHLGHRLVIEAAVSKSRPIAAPPRVLTFEPHPRIFFQPDTAPFRLTSPSGKERVLKECGIEDVIVLPFTKEFAELSASDFVEKILIDKLQVEHVVAGHDFVFGHKRSGDMKKLLELLARHKVGVTEITPLKSENGDVFSSTRIRDLLREGDTQSAEALLGRPWALSGIIMKGAQKGRTIGVPTANMGLGDFLRPKFGVYAVSAGKVGTPLSHKGVANIGLRPTVDGVSESLEAHLFDLNEDIYGQEWEFALNRFIRPEKKFDSFDALKAQIKEDIAVARSIL